MPGAFQTVSAPTVFRTPDGHVRAVRVADVLCALGKPQSFLASLREAQVELCEIRLLRDHDPLTGGNLLSGFSRERPIVVTAKDWVKLRERPDVGQYEFLIASHEVSVEPQAEFREWLQTKLNGIPQKTT
jgi:tetraacyldisaccharide 4'-kinase